MNAMKTSLSAIALTLLLSGCGSSSDVAKKVANPTTPAAPTPTPAEPVEPVDFQSIMDKQVEKDSVTGMVLYVNSPERQEWLSAGVADTQSLEAMPLDAIMPTGSSGKTMIAVLAIQLHEEGLLNLDDTLDTWLSEETLEAIENATQITLRQLLNHTSGIADYLHNPAFSQDLMAQPDMVRLDADIVQYIQPMPALFAPGVSFGYSNSNYVLAGLILDSVLGEHHASALRERILLPLGMDSTFYLGAETGYADIVSGYRDLSDLNLSDDTRIQNVKPLLENLGLADAPVASNAEDFAKFQRGVIAHDVLLSETAREQFIGEQSLVPLPGLRTYLNDGQTAYGLGIFIEENADTTLFHHGGDQFGWLTHNLYWVEADLQLVLMINCGGDDCENAAFEVVQSVLSDG